MHSSSTVLVTGIAGNLGTRLLPMLSNFHVVGVDLHPPKSLGCRGVSRPQPRARIVLP